MFAKLVPVPLILDGNRIRDQIKAECLPRVKRLLAHAGRPPGLAVVLVGNNPASQVYVRGKTKTAGELGIYNETITLSADISTDELCSLISSLNHREEIDGILVQLPLPKQIDEQRILLEITPEKDADGFHPYNAGLLATGQPGLRPCTPAGVIEMLKRYEIPIVGRNAVVVGRSNIVGRPMAMLLLQQNATVTICHSRTPDLAAITSEAEVLVVAAGRAGLIEPEHVAPGATVIDVGTNATPDGGLAGDVDPRVAEIAGAFSPVPGGVGPVTTALLLRHVTEVACASGG